MWEDVSRSWELLRGAHEGGQVIGFGLREEGWGEVTSPQPSRSRRSFYRDVAVGRMQLIATIDDPVVIQRIDPPAASYLPTVRSPIGELFSKVVDQGPIGTPDTLN